MIPALGFLWDRDRQLKFIDILSSFASDLSIASCSWFQIDVNVNIASLIITSIFLVDSLNGSDSKPSAANIFAMVCLIFDVLITETEEKLNQGNDNNSRTSDSDGTIQRGIIHEILAAS